MSTQNDTRRLAPDSKWILQVGGSVIGVIFAAVITVMQYQFSTLRSEHLRAIDQARAELVALRQTITTTTQTIAVARTDAFRARDQRMSDIERDIISLRESRARVGEQGNTLKETLDRLVTVAIDTQTRAAQSEGQIQELVRQSKLNAAGVTEMNKSMLKVAGKLSERLTALEARTQPPPPQAPR